jgi:hypothetical protein
VSRGQLEALYRARPGPTAAHLWQPDAANPLCGLVGRASGEWLRAREGFSLCSLCVRKRERYYPDSAY